MNGSRSRSPNLSAVGGPCVYSFNSQPGLLPLTTTRDKHFEHFVLQSFQHLLSNLATVNIVEMYGYPGMFTILSMRHESS
jgi:hypothetical protein